MKLPWLALLVLRDGEGDLRLGVPLPVVDVPGIALPDLADAWAWAHVEARMEAGESPRDAVTRDVLSGLDNVVSRLICPRRRLDPERAGLCGVPTTKAGRAAGLGGELPLDGAPAAWSPGQAQIKLPVYHAWRFRTGKAGSFEDLALNVDPVAGIRCKASAPVRSTYGIHGRTRTCSRASLLRRRPLRSTVP